MGEEGRGGEGKEWVLPSGMMGVEGRGKSEVKREGFCVLHHQIGIFVFVWCSPKGSGWKKRKVYKMTLSLSCLVTLS